MRCGVCCVCGAPVPTSRAQDERSPLRSDAPPACYCPEHHPHRVGRELARQWVARQLD